MNFYLKAIFFSDSSDDDILIRDSPDVRKQREQQVGDILGRVDDARFNLNVRNALYPILIYVIL